MGMRVHLHVRVRTVLLMPTAQRGDNASIAYAGEKCPGTAVRSFRVTNVTASTVNTFTDEAVAVIPLNLTVGNYSVCYLATVEGRWHNLGLGLHVIPQPNATVPPAAPVDDRDRVWQEGWRQFAAAFNLEYHPAAFWCAQLRPPCLCDCEQCGRWECDHRCVDARSA